MNFRKLRRSIIREMLKTKSYKSLRIPHRVVFMAEEYGLMEPDFRKRFNLGSRDYEYRYVKLYWLKRRLEINEMRNKKIRWGEPDGTIVT